MAWIKSYMVHVFLATNQCIEDTYQSNQDIYIGTVTIHFRSGRAVRLSSAPSELAVPPVQPCAQPGLREKPRKRGIQTLDILPR